VINPVSAQRVWRYVTCFESIQAALALKFDYVVSSLDSGCWKSAVQADRKNFLRMRPPNPWQLVDIRGMRLAHAKARGWQWTMLFWQSMRCRSR